MYWIDHYKKHQVTTDVFYQAVMYDRPDIMVSILEHTGISIPFMVDNVIAQIRNGERECEKFSRRDGPWRQQ